MERRDPKKQALAVGISIVLIVLIFFILTPPATAVYLDPGSPNPDSGEVGYEVTFNNVNLTIRGAERIPVDFLNFTIHNSDNDVVAWIKFYIDGTEISDYPSTALEVNTSTTIASSWYGYGTNTYGYDEEESYNLTGITGYGYGYITDITILYTINYTTQDAGTFYGKLSVNSTNYTYTSGQSSDFTVTEATSPDPTPSQPSGLSAEAGGPYTGLKGSALQFSGSASGGSSPYTYRWTFGDGGTGSGAAPSHTYTTAGTYTATLTVTDSESATDSDTATVTITTPTETTDEILNEILDQYGIELEEAFYGNDTDGDGKIDTLTDPNGVLTQVQNTIINDNAVILISTDDDDIPEFFWDADANTITPINQVTETESEAEIDTDSETITVTVTIDDKSGWIYIDITDSYPPDEYEDYTITISNGEETIKAIRLNILDENEQDIDIFFIDASEEYIRENEEEIRESLEGDGFFSEVILAKFIS